ncbi:uncharacterized protein TNCV_454081 [Trichonephila clavipes]|nr:uncharacterized protein TNCV_454081 [Trichonephila clavipes]
MSPFEHVWDMVGRRLARDPRPAASKDELLLRIQAIRNSLPQLDIKNLFDSMPRRIAALEGCGRPVVKVSDHVMSSSPVVPLKTHRVGQRCTLNLSRAETSSRWCGVVVRRGVPAQVSSTSLDHGSK